MSDLPDPAQEKRDLRDENERLREVLHDLVLEAQTMHQLVRHLVQRPPSDPEVVQERAQDILRRCGPDDEAPLHARIDARGLDAVLSETDPK